MSAINYVNNHSAWQTGRICLCGSKWLNSYLHHKGSGQGDPISSTLFLIATEPLNRLFATALMDLMYTIVGKTSSLQRWQPHTPCPYWCWIVVAHSFIIWGEKYWSQWTQHKHWQNQSTLYKHSCSTIWPALNSRNGDTENFEHLGILQGKQLQQCWQQ
jgi:hypothetical protein